MPKAQQKTFEDVLNAWAINAPPDMQHEPPREKILDSALRLFDSLSAARVTRLPPRRQLLQPLSHAVHWQWIALNIPAAPWVSILAPTTLTLAIIRWLKIWQKDQTPGQTRLMAAIFCRHKMIR
jgi:hypothetical protein